MKVLKKLLVTIMAVSMTVGAIPAYASEAPFDADITIDESDTGVVEEACETTSENTAVSGDEAEALDEAETADTDAAAEPDESEDDHNTVDAGEYSKTADNTIAAMYDIARPLPFKNRLEGWQGSHVYYGNQDQSGSGEFTPKEYYLLNRSSDRWLLACGDIAFWSKFDDETNKWEDSYIREALNGSGFLNKAGFLSSQEKAAIMHTTKKRASSGDGHGWPAFFDRFVPIDDKIFLLDAKELSNESYGFSDPRHYTYNLAEALDYAYPIQKSGWLRNDVKDAPKGVGLGLLNYNECAIVDAIYPAFNISTGNILLATAVDGVACEIGTKYKLTLKDDDITVKKNGSIFITNNTITIPYKVTGSNSSNVDELTVLVTSKEKTAGGSTVLSYGRLNRSGSSLTGTGTYRLPNELDGKTPGKDYFVYLLAEDRNGKYESDYAGCLSLYDQISVQYAIWVGDTKVTGDNAGDVLGDGTAEVYAESGSYVLKLDNANINKRVLDGSDNFAVIRIGDTDRPVRIEGSGVLTGTGNMTRCISSSSKYPLTIDADLKMTATNDAIYMGDGSGDLKFGADAKLDITVNSSSSNHHVISMPKGKTPEYNEITIIKPYDNAFTEKDGRNCLCDASGNAVKSAKMDKLSLWVGSSRVNETNKKNIPVKGGKLTLIKDPDYNIWKLDFDNVTGVVGSHDGAAVFIGKDFLPSAMDRLELTGKASIKPSGVVDGIVTESDCKGYIYFYGDFDIFGYSRAIDCERLFFYNGCSIRAQSNGNVGAIRGKGNFGIDTGLSILDPEEGCVIDQDDHKVVADAEGNNGDTFNFIVIGNVTKYGIWIGRSQITSYNKDNLPVQGNNASASYDPVTQTLTLKGVRGVKGSKALEKDPSRKALIYSKNNLTLKGDMELAGSTGTDYSVYSDSGVTFDGDISLNDPVGAQYLTVNGGTLKINGGKSSLDAVSTGTYTQNGGEVSVTSLNNGVSTSDATIPFKIAEGARFRAVSTGGTSGKYAVFSKTGFDIPDSMMISVPEGGSVISVSSGKTIGTGTTGAASVLIENKSEVPTQEISVVFNANGHGTMPATQHVLPGEKASRPAVTPTAMGYSFAGWFADMECKYPFDFDTALYRDTEIYAKWADGETTHTVSFYFKEDKIDELTLTVPHGECATAPLSFYNADYGTIYVREWETRRNKGRRFIYTIYDFETPVTGDLDLYVNNETASYDRGKAEFTVAFADYPDRLDFKYNGANKRYELQYNGSYIKPPVEVIGANGEALKEGTDYKLKYSNNKNVSKKKPAVVTVTGKGKYKGTKKLVFGITPFNFEEHKDENYADPNDVDHPVIFYDSPILAAKGAKISPNIYVYGRRLTAKDYKLSYTGKVSDDMTVTITGKGSYTGELAHDIPVKVTDRKTIGAKAVKVTLKPRKHYYEWDNKWKIDVAQTLDTTTYLTDPKELTVTDGTGKVLIKGTDYDLIYENNVHAGTARVIVIGRNGYSGRVSKTFKIYPCKVENPSIIMQNADKPYIRSGAMPVFEVKVGERIISPYSNDTSRFYTATYTKNKAAGVGSVSIKFKGDYKGTPSVSTNFEIIKAKFEPIVTLPDQVYRKPGKYFPAPLVTIRERSYMQGSGVATYVYEGAAEILLKKKEYKDLKYWDCDTGEQILVNKKFELKPGEDVKKVKVTLKGDGKNYEETEAVGYYYIRRQAADKIDLSKAKIYAKGTKKSIASQPYSGKHLEPEIDVKIKQNKKWVTVDPSLYTVKYLNNVEKGKATVVVTGKVSGDATGSKTASFRIVARKFSLFKLLS